MIEFKNVAYSYGGDALLKDVSLSLPQGSFHFLTGPSGAGKSTLLKLCYLELSPVEGALHVFGKATEGLGRDEVALLRRRIGIVHQDCQFLDHLPVAENIALPVTVSGRDVHQDIGDLTGLIEWVGLKHRAEAYPPELSGGERQRAALARAIVMSPDLILADEPTGNVDWEMSMRLVNLLVDLNKLGKTVLMATHDLHLIRATKAQVAARVLRINDRNVQLAGADL